MNLLKKYIDVDAQKLAGLLKIDIKRLRYIKLAVKRRDNHKVIALGYAAAITVAFILSLTNNNDVNASITPTDTINYIMLENALDRSMEDSAEPTLYPEKSLDNIKSLYNMVNVKEKNVEKELTVSKGDTFISLISSLGLDYNQAHALYSKFKKIYDPASLRIGQKIIVSLTEDIQTHEMLSLDSIVIEPKSGQRYILERNDQNEYIAKAEKDELLEEINNASGTIQGSLSVSMRKQGVPGKIVAKFSNIFGQSVDFRRDVHNGDKFEVIYENHITPSGEVIKTGNILYAGLVLRKTRIELYRFADKNGNVDYYNEKGLAMKRTLHRKPLAFQRARISSPFGKRRHPILKRTIVHWGVDYAAPSGTAIYAGGDGVIQVAKYNGGYGNYIKIRHNSEYSTAYGHMKSFAKGIRPGVRVKQGQVIGYVGSTGRSTGPHLHYEVVQNGRRVNPLKIKAAAGENLAGNNLTKFKQQVAELKQTYKTMFAQNEPAKMAEK
ncbi:MAG: peptidoglycan DD-metalloendopeptidase family protein [Alphaproteobacteria bacterium]|nr:peptidoglycan DD-metalloendopeptidase family protein [Alphaproteobacteria bacterium]